MEIIKIGESDQEKRFLVKCECANFTMILTKMTGGGIGIKTVDDYNDSFHAWFSMDDLIYLAEFVKAFYTKIK